MTAPAKLYRPTHGGRPTYSPPPPWWPDRDYRRGKSWWPPGAEPVYPTPDGVLRGLRGYVVMDEIVELVEAEPDPIGHIVDATMDGPHLRATVRFDRPWDADRYRK